jgi:hypothetical protein
MNKFLYLTFCCWYEDLQAALDKHGQEGWRLHTCEPVMKIGHLGVSGALEAFVVMDKHVFEEAAKAPEELAKYEPAVGIPMRG